MLSLLIFALFLSEFLLKSNHHRLYLKFFSDKELHFLAFLIVPFVVYCVVSKYKHLYLLTSFIFLLLTYFIEELQNFFGYRCFSILDFKYSLSGFIVYCVLIFFLKTLSYTEKAAV